MTLCFPMKVLNQHIAFLGKTGAGKSSAMRTVVEWLLDHKKRCCIIDPKGDWWGLKSSADGKSAGYPVIAFGDFKESKASDIPINQHSGKHVAELIASGNRPCIIGFRGWMPGEMVKFWLEFAPTLFNSNEGELYVIIDEVHNFAPKGKVLDPDSGKCLHWTNRILSEGRGLGLTFVIASQRAQKVHNDTLDCCETLVAMRVSHPAARQSVKDWIDGNGDPVHGAEVMRTLAKQQRGEAWVWSPEIDFGPERVKFPMFQTFDSFAPPQLQKKVSGAGWAEVDLEAVKEKLSAVIEEAKANDPKELRLKIQQLQAELRNRPVSQQVKEVMVSDPHAIYAAVKARDIEWISAVSAFRNELDKLNLEAPKFPVITERVVKKQETLSSPVVHAVSPVKESNGVLSGPEQRIINSIAWFNTIGIEEPEQTAVAFLSGYVVNGGGFTNPRGSLNTKHLLQYVSGGRIKLTDSGKAKAEIPSSPLNTFELQRMVMQRLPGPEQKILTVLLGVYPAAMTNEDCAMKTGYNPDGGGYTNPRGRLKSLGLIEYPERGQVKAKSLLFLDK